jgi:hypothetical protein
MIDRFALSPRALRIALAATLALAAAGVQAMTVSYQCTGRRLLTAELNPRKGHLHFEGKDWAVMRVPAGGAARYVSKDDDIEVVTKARALTFTHGSQTLQCLLYSDALPGDAPHTLPTH